MKKRSIIATSIAGVLTTVVVGTSLAHAAAPGSGPQQSTKVPSTSITANGNENFQAAYGSDVKLAWKSNNVTTCRVTPGNYKDTSNSRMLRALTANATYSINCSGSYGTTSDSVTITIAPPTFAYLKGYLKTTADHSPITSKRMKPLINQVSQAEKLAEQQKRLEARAALQSTVEELKGLTSQKQVKQQYLDGFMQALDKLLASWPPVVPVPTPPAPTPMPTPTPTPTPTPPTPSPGTVSNGGYPDKWANAPQSSLIDSWGMYNRGATSYAAYKVAASGRFMPYWGGIGNANQWDENAIVAGIPVDGNPKVGDVAISNRAIYGHAMYVEKIDPDGALHVSDYDRGGSSGQYSEHSLAPSLRTSLVFIHFP